MPDDLPLGLKRVDSEVVADGYCTNIVALIAIVITGESPCLAADALSNVALLRVDFCVPNAQAAELN